MRGIDDTGADGPMALTGLRQGDEIAEVDDFRTDSAQGITVPDRVISDLGERLAAARVRAADADVDPARSDDHRRESSVAAARLLEIAAANADRLVADAREEADSLVVAARAEAERVTAELDQHRTMVLRELADRQAAVEAKVRRLRQLESEHLNHLRRHFTEQLAQLEEITPEVPLAAVAD